MNTLVGTNTADRLETSASGQTLVGGLGDDLYIVNHESTQIVESISEGIDQVESRVSFVLPEHVEHLTLVGSDPLSATGNAQNNQLTGNIGDNRLTGGLGQDQLTGGAGRDTFVFTTAVDSPINQPDLVTDFTQGQDLIDLSGLNLRFTRTASTGGLWQQYDANLQQTLLYADTNGDGQADLQINLDGEHQLTRADFTGILPNRAPTSTTYGTQHGFVTLTVSNQSPIELLLIHTGTDPDGDPIHYELVGESPEQLSLNKQTGLITYTPSDTDVLMRKGLIKNISLSYRVSDGELVSGIQQASVTIFGGNEPTTITGGNLASVAERPNPNFSGEPLSYQSGYITLSTPNPLYPEQNFKPFISTDQLGTFILEASSAWHYQLDTSNQDLQRMTSNDTYVMRHTGFVTYDGINFAAPYDKAFYVTIYGSDVYQGDAANNHYLGGYLDDQMSGLAGQDTFYGGAGNDQLLGGQDNDLLYGEDGDDVLDGGTGIDSMDGGAGNDTYYVDHRNDVVIEQIGIELFGQDQVYSSIDYTLGVGVEWLQLTGRDSLDGTGNAADNRIDGNQGHNHLSGLNGNDALNGGGGNDFLEGGRGDDVLDGGLGKDLMYGGEGDDQYYVSTLGDYTYEWADQGYDTVHSSISWTLAHHIEALHLTGEQNINATGNSADNLLIGNSGSNRIDGKLGDNQLIGAAGDDLYLIKRGYGLNEIQESAELDGGVDQVAFGYGISAQQLWFSQSNQDLLIEVIGSETQVLIKDWYGTAAGAVESFQLDNGQQLSASQVQVLVSAMADMSPEVIGRSLSRPQYRALEGVFNSTWGNMAG